jgi:hypothetical protein
MPYKIMTMSATRTFNIKVSYCLNNDGTFSSVSLFKGIRDQNQMPPNIVAKLNWALNKQLIQKPATIDKPTVAQIPAIINEPIATINEPIVESKPATIIEQMPATIDEPIVEQKPATIVAQMPANTDKLIVESTPATITEPIVVQPPVANMVPNQPVMYIPNHGYVPVQLVAATQSSASIGKNAEDYILNYLNDISCTNTDFQVHDTSNLKNHGDIAVKYRGNRICIEIKHYQSRLPVKEIQKFHKSLALPEYDAGIIIQVGKQGFAASENIMSPIDIKFNNKKPTAYLTHCQPEIIYPIINILIANLNTALDESKLQVQHKKLLTINDKVVKLRKTIDTQKKSIATIESVIESIVSLSLT